MNKYNKYIGNNYAHCAIEINHDAAQDGYDVLPMRIDYDMNIDVDYNRLMVWIDDESIIQSFEVG